MTENGRYELIVPAIKRAEDGLAFGQWPQVESVLPKFLQRKAIVRGRPAEQNVPKLRNWLPESFGKTREATGAFAVLEEWFDESA